MLIFAIAFVPEGNMIRQIRKIVSCSFRSGDRLDAYALPEGIYLGFYSPGVPGIKEGELARSFRRSSENLFQGLPPLLCFDRSVYRDGKSYLAPCHAFPEAIAALADKIASDAGYSQAECQPFVAGAGFFAGNDVTPPPFEAFSFRHLDAVLLKIESADQRFNRAWWRVVERTSRRTGARLSRRLGKDAAGRAPGSL